MALMATEKLEDRVTAVEIEVERLKQQFESEKSQKTIPWYEKIFGTFKDDPDYEEAMRLGKEYRMSQQPDYENEIESP
jgi:hypothetical protein